MKDETGWRFTLRMYRVVRSIELFFPSWWTIGLYAEGLVVTDRAGGGLRV